MRHQRTINRQRVQSIGDKYGGGRGHDKGPEGSTKTAEASEEEIEQGDFNNDNGGVGGG